MSVLVAKELSTLKTYDQNETRRAEELRSFIIPNSCTKSWVCSRKMIVC